MITKKQNKQQQANENYNKKVHNGELHLIKARLNKEEANYVNQLKQEKGISTSSKTLKHIINDYFKAQQETDISTHKVQDELSSTKIETLEGEIAKLKEENSVLVEENELLKLNLSKIPFEDKLKNYSVLIIQEALDKSGIKGEINFSLGELHFLCTGFPKDIVDLYQNDFFNLMEVFIQKVIDIKEKKIKTYLEKTDTKNRDELIQQAIEIKEEIKEGIEFMNLDENLIKPITDAAYRSFRNIYPNNISMINNEGFSRWYIKAIQSTIVKLQSISHE
ncbi:hypothetical protein [Colwellia sp. 12G3]|uniref:hypothetical protein n=1 Tax=Colwellia sp. 12G3 TaxID=2058299 RepID=UPI000C326CEB|nr:hypothetical protein [Colwellia sp. 12G3]PKI12766.1 hypothetical protein CXF71_18705 [Colwellia sp. 12G3]